MELKVKGVGPMFMNRLAPDGPGSVVEGPSGATITFEELLESRAVDIPPEAMFAITLIGAASAQLIADGLAGWIRETFGDSPTTIVTINRRTLDLDDLGQVRRVIEEEIIEQRRS